MSKRNLEAIFPLRPNQLAMMWQADPSRLDPGLIQVRWELSGDLDPAAFRQAWQQVLTRHQAMRASVHLREGMDPMMVIWRALELPVSFNDLSELSAKEQTNKTRFILDDNRRRGLSIHQAPVSRVDVYLMRPNTHMVIWRCHHLLLDGWSSATVVSDVLTAYQALVDKQSPQLPALECHYADYLNWLKTVDREKAGQFWSEYLGQIRETRSVFELAQPSSNGFLGSRELGCRESQLDDRASQAIAAFRTQNSVTASALCQAAWAALLYRISNHPVAVFGHTVSGRAAPLAGIQHLAGMFTHVTPVITAVERQVDLIPWIQRLRDGSFESQPHAWMTMAEMPGPVAATQFDTLLVVENFPQRTPNVGGVVMSDYASDVVSTYPVTLCVIPDRDWTIRLIYDRERVAEALADWLFDSFRSLLLEFCRGPNRTVGQLVDTITSSPNWDAKNSAVDESVSVGVQRKPRPVTPGPANITEAKLAMIWEEALGLAGQIDTQASFFELGGKSITAMRIFARVEEVFGQRLSPAVLLQHSSIAALAGFLESGTETGSDVLVPLRKSGNKPPLVCVHVGGGYSLYYRHLIRYLHPSRPVWGLHPLGLEGGKRHESMDELVDCFNSRLLKQFPTGDLHLAGYCIGAVASVEMARQLAQQGTFIRSLTLFDSGPAGSQPRRQRKSFREFLSEKSLPLAVRGMTNFAKFQLHRQTRKIAQPLADTWKMRVGGMETRRQLYLDLVERSCRSAYTGFRQRPVPIPINLIRSSDYQAREDKRFHLKWSEFTPDLRIQVVDAVHETLLLEPDVGRLAPLLESLWSD